MAKVTAPLLSMGASGQIGKTQVYGKWKGVDYARRYVTPSNPQSSEQTATRTVFYYLTQFWKLASASVQAPWSAYATGKALTNRNAFIGQNTKSLRTMTNMADFVASPGSGGGLAPAAISVAASSLNVTATITAPTLPTGWTITKATALAVLDGDPATATDFNSWSADDNTSPYAPVIAVPAAGAYRVFGFFEFAKPDGSVAYGTALNETVTVS